MVKWIIIIAVYLFMHYYIYKKVSSAFSNSTRWNVSLKVFMVFAGMIYPTIQLLHFVFSVTMQQMYIVYPFIYSGFLWIMALPTLCALCFLETGLSLIFPTLTSWWLRGIPIVFAFRVFFLIKGFPYGKEIPAYYEILDRTILIAIYFLVAVLLFKIIAGTLNLPGKKRGILLIIFSTGPLLAFFGIEIAVMSLIFGFYAVVFARVSAGLKLSKKMKTLVLIILGMGIIISLPQMLWWGNILAIPSLYCIGGCWYGIIIIAFTLFLLESGIALIFPNHPRRRIIIVFAFLTIISGYGIINGFKTPIVKEVIIPLKKLPANAQNFIIVLWSDIHLGDLVSPNWFRDTVLLTNKLKPDLVLITGDMIDNGFEKTYIETLKQINTKFGIFAVTGNHEYYFNKLNKFLEIAEEAGIRVLRNNLVTLANGIQIAGINDAIAPEFNDLKPSIPETVKNSNPQKLLIMLSHRAKFFQEAVRNGIDLQLSGHYHIGQLPPLDLVIYLTLKYPYGLYREKNSYIYTSCGTGLWAIPMRIFSHSEITKIILKKE